MHELFHVVWEGEYKWPGSSRSPGSSAYYSTPVQLYHNGMVELNISQEAV